MRLISVSTITTVLYMKRKKMNMFITQTEFIHSTFSFREDCIPVKPSAVEGACDLLSSSNLPNLFNKLHSAMGAVSNYGI